MLKCALYIFTFIFALSVWPEQDSSHPMPTNCLVVMETTLGDITLQLADGKAADAAANFLAYVDQGCYDGTIIHSVIAGFMIKGGGFTREFSHRTTDIEMPKLTSCLPNRVGTIGLYRNGHTNGLTAQFFINLKDNELNVMEQAACDCPGYCVFGKVCQGMDVVEAIAAVETGRRGPFLDVPMQPIEILKVYRFHQEPATRHGREPAHEQPPSAPVRKNL